MNRISVRQQSIFRNFCLVKSSLSACALPVIAAASLAACADSKVAGEGSGDPSPDDEGNFLPSFEVRTPRALITTSDFTVGETYLFDPATGEASEGIANGDQDTIPEFAFSRSILMERGVGTLRAQREDDALVTERTLDLRDDISDPSPNPQQVVTTEDQRKAYVVQLQSNELAIFRLLDNNEIIRSGEIDLSTFVAGDDTDGFVDAAGAILLSEDRLAVTLGRYDFDAEFTQRFLAPALLVVIDTERDELVDLNDSEDGIQGIELAGTNPSRAMVYDADSDSLFVHVRGAWGVADGGIERVDMSQNVSSGVVLSESELETRVGGELYTLAATSPSQGFLQVGTQVYAWNPLTNTLDETAVASDIDGFSNIATVGDRLYAWGNNVDAPGLRVFDVQGESVNESTPEEGPVTFGELPIYGLAPAR